MKIPVIKSRDGDGVKSSVWMSLYGDPHPISLSWYPHQGIYPKGGVHTTCALLYLYLVDVAIRSRRHGGCCDGHPSRCPMEMMPSIVSACGVLVTARHQHTVPHIWCHAQQGDSIPVVLEQSTPCMWGGMYIIWCHAQQGNSIPVV